ncbi:MAG TPA: hypothetical protein VI815_04700 [Candidatus Nanoarchaeia archaeon]|nr:hypothetical protein [Candidatus Nanoarchaeia archaeon]
MEKKSVIFGGFFLTILVLSVFLVYAQENNDIVICNGENDLLQMSTLCPPVCEYDCMVPDTLGDVETEIIFPSFGNETNLKTILESQGYFFNTTNDQSNIQVWNITSDAIIEIKVLGKVAAANQAFGYYLNHNTSTFTPIFEAGDHPLYNVPLSPGNDTYQISVNAGEVLGFAMDSFYGNSVIYYTENEFNPGQKDHAVMFDLCNEFIIGFENSGNEPDYQDLIVSVKLIECNQVCEDKDNDGVCDEEDYCPNSMPNEPIDSYGCDIFQFCEGFSCGPDCLRADWLSNEPSDRYPRDCKVVLTHNNGIPQQPKCVPTEFSSMCAG